MYAALCGVYSLLPHLPGKSIKLLVDNTAVVGSLSHRWSQNLYMMAMIFELCFLATKFRFRFFVDWIASEDNHFADALSRFQMKRLRALTLGKRLIRRAPHRSLWPLSREILRSLDAAL